MIYCGKEACIVTTILGSCVSVCLFDSRIIAGGINHFMLPFWNGDGLESPKYGNIAIKKLIEEMGKIGCEKDNLRAKVFGGANILRGDISEDAGIGRRNIEIAMRILQQEKIPVISSSVGEYYGRKIIFNTGTGEVFMKKIPRKDT